MNPILEKRIKSLAWRVGMMTAAFVLATVAENLSMLDLDPGFVMVVGLVLGEVSKYLNSKA
jgi:hypothetical protein